MRIISITGIALAISVLSAPALAGVFPLAFVMHAQGGSGQTGRVTVRDISGGMVVTIALTGEPAGASEPAHIHTGTCSSLGAPWKPLSNVVNGTSTTVIKGVMVKPTVHTGYAVNVHKSDADLGTTVACGELLKK